LLPGPSRSRSTRCFQNLFQRTRRPSRHQPHNSLMLLRIRQPVDLGSILEPHRNIPRTRQLHNFFHARILAAPRNHNAVKRSPRLQRLPHRMYPRQPIHFLSTKIKLSSTFGPTKKPGTAAFFTPSPSKTPPFAPSPSSPQTPPPPPHQSTKSRD